MYNDDDWLYFEEFLLTSAVHFPSKVKGKKWSEKTEYRF